MTKRVFSLMLSVLLLLPMLQITALAVEPMVGDSDSALVRDYAWNPVPPAVRAYLEQVTYDPLDYSVSRISDFAPEYAETDNLSPIGQRILVPNGTLNCGGFEQKVKAGMATFFNDIPNQVTSYTVRDTSEMVIQTGTLYPNGSHLRMIHCPTAVNFRDLGGWTCDGGTVKYGLLFRGGSFTEADRDVIINQLGVRHELDLRGKDEAADAPSVLKDAIGYSVFDRCAWYHLGDTMLWRQMLQTVFDCVENNRPIFFHCSAGADRTGTLACVLEALLGMSQSDIDKDYEITSFATGTGTDERARRRNESDWRRLIQELNEKPGDTFRDKAVSFVLELGFQLDEINAFRATMIDGTPEIITIPLTPTPTPLICDGGEYCPSVKFEDVDHSEKSWYHLPVDWAITSGVSLGVSESSFLPNANCTRGQMVTFLWRSAGCPNPESSKNPFTDVKDGAFYYDAILWAAENGITSGTSKNSFSPNEPVNRAQAVTFLWRMAEKPTAPADNPFKDVKSGQYYTDAVVWAAENNITTGTTKTTFEPLSNCDRSQIVTFLYRYNQEQTDTQKPPNTAVVR